MQFKALASVFFAVAALAQSSDDLMNEMESVPTSIMAVLETAVPTSWINAFETNSAFQSSEINNILAGTYPAWYSSLPESVKQYATSEVLAQASEYASYMSLMSTDSAATPSVTGTTSSGSTSGSSATQTGTTTSGSSSSDKASSSAASTSTSTGGAPVATGVTMGLAGAAGILGLAIAL
ncbi:hypothetical protein BDV25DRAFT_149145 [Aspergillus avenaceus]|uniref:Uncharacterized protein n=1 Tax=Aspergillus avenaceus TaxID=36643 RepID=A0A5N6U4T6_ASPAV|nr:hypothetical protein BDV25DRAFT_149145 [Aspergillus avenaceus]